MSKRNICFFIAICILLMSCSKQNINQINDNNQTSKPTYNENIQRTMEPKILSAGIDNSNKVEDYKNFIVE